MILDFVYLGFFLEFFLDFGFFLGGCPTPQKIPNQIKKIFFVKLSTDLLPMFLLFIVFGFEKNTLQTQKKIQKSKLKKKKFNI